MTLRRFGKIAFEKVYCFSFQTQCSVLSKNCIAYFSNETGFQTYNLKNPEKNADKIFNEFPNNWKKNSEWKIIFRAISWLFLNEIFSFFSKKWKIEDNWQLLAAFLTQLLLARASATINIFLSQWEPHPASITQPVTWNWKNNLIELNATILRAKAKACC